MTYSDLLAGAVTADQGVIAADTEDGKVPCVRLVFHYAQGHPHGEAFMEHKGLDRLIAELSAIRDQYMGRT